MSGFREAMLLNRPVAPVPIDIHRYRSTRELMATYGLHKAFTFMSNGQLSKYSIRKGSDSLWLCLRDGSGLQIEVLGKEDEKKGLAEGYVAGDLSTVAREVKGSEFDRTIYRKELPETPITKLDKNILTICQKRFLKEHNFYKQKPYAERFRKTGNPYGERTSHSVIFDLLFDAMWTQNDLIKACYAVSTRTVNSVWKTAVTEGTIVLFEDGTEMRSVPFNLRYVEIIGGSDAGESKSV